MVILDMVLQQSFLIIPSTRKGGTRKGVVPVSEGVCGPSAISDTWHELRQPPYLRCRHGQVGLTFIFFESHALLRALPTHMYLQRALSSSDSCPKQSVAEDRAWRALQICSLGTLQSLVMIAHV